MNSQKYALKKLTILLLHWNINQPPLLLPTPREPSFSNYVYALMFIVVDYTYIFITFKVFLK